MIDGFVGAAVDSCKIPRRDVEPVGEPRVTRHVTGLSDPSARLRCLQMTPIRSTPRLSLDLTPIR